MMLLNEDHLRVITPLTSNGIAPIIGPDGRQKTKITHLPISALKELEKRNTKLPDYLKKKIEVIRVNEFVPPVIQEVKIAAIKQKPKTRGRPKSKKIIKQDEDFK